MSNIITDEKNIEDTSKNKDLKAGIRVMDNKMKMTIPTRDYQTENQEEKNIKFNIQDVDLFYGNFQALYNNNLEIHEKEVTAF